MNLIWNLHTKFILLNFFHKLRRFFPVQNSCDQVEPYIINRILTILTVSILTMFNDLLKLLLLVLDGVYLFCILLEAHNMNT